MLPKVFISYSHKDAAHQQRLKVHLAPLVREGLRVFYDGCITPGADLDAEIRRELRESSIFVALASPDYLNSEYCVVKEYGYARRRAARKTMFVVAVILRPCGWKATRMARYKSLPRDGREVISWASRDAAYEDVIAGLRRVIVEAVAMQGAGARKAPSKSSKSRPKRTVTKDVAATTTRSVTAARKATAKTKKIAATLGRPPKSASKSAPPRPRSSRSSKPPRRTRPTAG